MLPTLLPTMIDPVVAWVPWVRFQPTAVTPIALSFATGRHLRAEE